MICYLFIAMALPVVSDCSLFPLCFCRLIFNLLLLTLLCDTSYLIVFIVYTYDVDASVTHTSSVPYHLVAFICFYISIDLYCWLYMLSLCWITLNSQCLNCSFIVLCCCISSVDIGIFVDMFSLYALCSACLLSMLFCSLPLYLRSFSLFTQNSSVCYFLHRYKVL